MRSIERASAFKKDFKRVKATPKHAKNIDGLLENVLELLITNQPLPDNNKDHHLTGNLVGYRECHLKPDLLLIYKKTDNYVLRLARMGLTVNCLDELDEFGVHFTVALRQKEGTEAEGKHLGTEFFLLTKEHEK